MSRSRFAPAKVNLFLHVGPPGGDGYHPVASLMSFADVGDRIKATAADRFALELSGRFATDLAGEALGDNLVWRAATRLFAFAGVQPPPLKLTLVKDLPVAAGLGGGSSDAGAALTLLRDMLSLPATDADLGAIAGELGADGPVCLAARPVLAQGRGDRLSPAPAMPLLPAVLVNPGCACSTGAVYRTFDAQTMQGRADLPRLEARYDTPTAVATAMALCRNDLEPPAISVAPAIADVLNELRDQPGALLARLSGSGATAFALCASDPAAELLARRIAALRPHWWVRQARLGGPWTERHNVHELVSVET